MGAENDRVLKARLLLILAVCYVLAAVAARPAGSFALLRADADSLRTDSLRPLAEPTDSVGPGAGIASQDSVAADSVPRSKNALDLPVTYSAQDSITFDYGRSRANLYATSYRNTSPRRCPTSPRSIRPWWLTPR